MKHLITVFIFIFLFITSPSKGKDFYWIIVKPNEWKKSGRTEFLDGKLTSKVLDAFDSIYSSHPHSYVFYDNSDMLKGFVGCTFDYYQINESSIVNQYKYLNRGYTCTSKIYERDSQVYLLGGYGFWNHHVDLLSFNELNNGWELVQTQNQPTNYAFYGMYETSKGFYSLFGEFIDERKGIREKEENGYFLDWETKEWKALEIFIEDIDSQAFISSISAVGGLETKDYYYLNFRQNSSSSGWYIIEKEKGIIYFYDFKWSDLDLSPYVEVIGNTVNFLTQTGENYSLNFDSLVSQSKEVGWIKVVENPQKPLLPMKDLIYVTIISTLSFGLMFLLIRKKGNETNSNGFEDLDGIIESLMKYSGQLLENEKLDELLEVNTLTNLDSRRLKRSRLINRINQYYQSQKGKDLIFRDKNPEDKRYIYYRIEP